MQLGGDVVTFSSPCVEIALEPRCKETGATPTPHGEQPLAWQRHKVNDFSTPCGESDQVQQGLGVDAAPGMNAAPV